MILKHYGLREQPFGATPDPQFLYASKIHREALASLLYAVESGRGFTALIAPPGLGKTTLLFHLLGTLRGKAKTAFVFQTQCKPRELLRFLLTEFGVKSPSADFVSMHHALNDLVAAEAAAGRKCVIVLDEAHNLSDSVLESVRLLSDFETPNRKLLQIVMAGQSELKTRLSQPSLTQLRQRIGVVCKLGPLPPKEIDEYIQHRLKAAGYAGPPLFTPAATAVIRAFSHGIPRNINALCFSAMSLGFALGRRELDAQVLEEAVSDLSLEAEPHVSYEDYDLTDTAWRSTQVPEPVSAKAVEEPVSVAGAEADPAVATFAATSATAGAETREARQPSGIETMEAATSAETQSESEPVVAAHSESLAQTGQSNDAQNKQDPLLNIDLSAYALLEGIPGKKKPVRAEEDEMHGSPWSTARPISVAHEPELEVLKQRLANHSYPQHAAARDKRGDYVVLGLIAAVLVTAILGAMLWIRPNVGFAMGKPQPEQPSPNLAPPVATAEKKIDTPGSGLGNKKRRSTTPPLPVTTAAMIKGPAPSHANAEAATVETPPPSLSIMDPARTQQLNDFMASSTTQPQLAPEQTSAAEDAEINTPLEMIPPVYPKSAKQNNLEGTVVLQILVDKDGKVRRLQRISGDPQLAEAAIAAVRQWRYRPIVVNGKQAESSKQVEMRFSLGDTSAGDSSQ